MLAAVAKAQLVVSVFESDLVSSYRVKSSVFWVQQRAWKVSRAMALPWLEMLLGLCIVMVMAKLETLHGGTESCGQEEMNRTPVATACKLLVQTGMWC
jgi:hypothetical protein